MQRLLALALMLTFALTGLAGAEPFSATGRGTTEEAAITQALNNALDLAVKQILDEETVKNNKQKITQALKGKTRKLARVTQKGEPEFTGAGYEINLTAEVNLKALEKEIDALGLMQDTMGNPRIMVLYNPNLPQGSTLGSTRADLEAFFDNSYGAIVEVLADKGFDVIDKASAHQFSVQVAETHENGPGYQQGRTLWPEIPGRSGAVLPDRGDRTSGLLALHRRSSQDVPAGTADQPQHFPGHCQQGCRIRLVCGHPAGGALSRCQGCGSQGSHCHDRIDQKELET